MVKTNSQIIVFWGLHKHYKSNIIKAYRQVMCKSSVVPLLLRFAKAYTSADEARKLYNLIFPEQDLFYPSWEYGKDFFMKELNNSKKYALILALVLVIFGIFTAFSISNKNFRQNPKLSPTIVQKAEENDIFNYEGKNNIDALTLLKKETEVKQDDSGMVTSINGRAANPDKREFWSFYVNGQMAQVGPADYITKDEDRIEWKIEKY